MRMHARTCADSAFLTVPVVCLQTRTLGSDSRSRQSYPGHLWQFDDVHHRRARVHRLPICCDRVSFFITIDALTIGALIYRCAVLGNIIRMKAILFTFVRSFDFELAVPPDQITKKTFIARPFLTSDQDSGPQLPLIIRPAKSD
jgi:hypothetical protein